MRLLENINKYLDKLGFKHFSDEGINPEQLKKGTDVEMEHTTNPEVARLIALAHLHESPRYYIELEKMEKKLDA